jgi:hypothetical protein
MFISRKNYGKVGEEMKCYNCKKTVEQEEHEKVDRKFDEFEQEDLLLIEEHLDLLCLTDNNNDVFDENGFVVVCDECLKKAINYYKERRR